MSLLITALLVFAKYPPTDRLDILGLNVATAVLLLLPELMS